LPIGILAIVAIYVLAQLGAMSALPDLSKTETPIADAAAALVGTWGAVIITLGALLSMAGTNSGTVLEGSRMLYALSLDRRSGPVSYVHPKFHTPTVAIVIHVAVAMVLSLAGSFAQMALMSTVARLTTYLAGCASLPFLGNRTSKTVILAILGVIVSLTFVITLHAVNAIAAVIALTVGALIYLGVGKSTAQAN